ncbi:MAG: M28 family peptidase, partial [Anaerolineales bacterium]
YGIETVRSESGGSDHASFLDAGLDAAVLIWQDPEGMYGDYHRPLDSPGRLDPVLLERAGFVAHLGLLSVVEGEPLIQELLDQRGQALLDGDLQAFLATGDPEQAAGEEAWFDSAREPQLHEAAFDLLSLYPREGTLRGVVQVTLVYPMEGDEERTRRVSEGVAVQFQKVDGSWRWMGPDLVEWSMDTADGTIAQSAEALGVQVFAPPGTAVDAAVIEPALASLREASRTLGMRIPAKLRIEFYASAGDIGIFSDPGSGRDLANWMGPNVLRLLATSSTTSSENLAPAFLQWLLAANGIHREQAAWLWDGLALGLQVQLSPERYHPALLPDLYWSLLDGSDPEPRTAAWAAVEYIHQRYGWGGLGRSIRTLGMRCASLDCASSEGLNAAYEAALGMTLDEFEAAWQGYWRNRLETIVNRLQATLDKRSAAIRSGSSSQFLATVDPSVPNLVADQRGYFERVRSGTLSDLDWGVEVRTIFDDGRILARVGRVSGSSTTPRRPTTNWTEVLFTPSASGLRWADYPLQRLVASRVTVLYPEGYELMAEQLLTLLQEMRTALASALGLNPSGSITLKIYPSVNALINSVPLERSEDLPAILSTPGGSLRMALTNEGSQTVEDLRSAIIESMTRSMLLESGLDREWLLRGLSLYIAPEIDQRERMFRATQFLARIASADQRGSLPALTGMPLETSLDQESRELTAAQAWDAVHFLVDLYGEDVIGKILARIHAGDDFEQAFLAATQHSEQEFAENWLDSILRAHLTAEQIELSESFDPAGAMAYVEGLTGLAYRGRAAGTEGANAAAETIRKWFDQLGLQPAVVLEPAELPGMTAGQEAGKDNQDGDAAIDVPADTGYEQLFDIFQVPLARAPALMVSRLDSAEVFSLRYRYDFLSVPQAYSYAGPVAGELIWLRVDENYPDVDLTGKIVLRFNPGPIEEEINAAIEKGAAGLILVTEDEARYPFLSKAPPYGREPARFDIPVFEIRRGAYQQLVLAAGQNPVSLQEGPAIVRFGMQAEMDLPTLPAERVETANILGYIPGADPDLADEVVILGAHYDHVGDDPDAWRCEPGVTPEREAIRLGLCRLEAGLRYSGANDDASGIAALLEIARIMKEAGYRPARSILFAAWGAQELGEIGSEFYLAHPFFPLQKTAAMIQLDSIAGGRG